MAEPKRRFSLLGLVVFLLVAGFTALVAWLELSYVEEPSTGAAVDVERPEVTVSLPSAPSDGAAETPSDKPPSMDPPAEKEPGSGQYQVARAPTEAPAPAQQEMPSAPRTDVAKVLPQAEPKPAIAVGPPEPPPRQATSEPLWRQHARPFEGKADWPRIAILVWDLGLSKTATTSAIKDLPGEVTLGLSAVARDLQIWADQARRAGHEVVVQVPMEPLSYPEDDPGPNTLLTFLSSEENLRHLTHFLDQFEGYVGVANYMGSRFTSSENDVRPVLEELKARGLIFLDTRAASNSVAFRIAGEIGLDRAANSRYIDNTASRSAIDARLAELERVARTRGTAVGIGAPYPVTIERLAQWTRTLESKGIQLAPLSAVIEQGGAG